MSKLHYIENFGTGIPRILEAYESSKRKVDFSVSENFFNREPTLYKLFVVKFKLRSCSQPPLD